MEWLLWNKLMSSKTKMTRALAHTQSSVPKKKVILQFTEIKTKFFVYGMVYFVPMNFEKRSNWRYAIIWPTLLAGWWQRSYLLPPQNRNSSILSAMHGCRERLVKNGKYRRTRSLTEFLILLSQWYQAPLFILLQGCHSLS